MPDSTDAATPVTFDVHCAHCGGAVVLQFGEWAADADLDALLQQVWACPYCLQPNTGQFPGRLLWATEQSDEPEPGPQ